MKQTEFVLRRFVNRNGATSWRVAGWLHAVRIRKNLPTREEAAAEKAALEIKAVQASSGLRPALTCLPDDQLRETESVFRVVADRKRSLTFYVNFALSNYRDPENEKSLKTLLLPMSRCAAPRKSSAACRTVNSRPSAANCVRSRRISPTRTSAN